MALDRIRKRDGSVTPFEMAKIAAAIGKALATDGLGEPGEPALLAREVHDGLQQRFGADAVPTVEQVQDAVEETLIRRGLTVRSPWPVDGAGSTGLRFLTAQDRTD